MKCLFLFLFLFSFGISFAQNFEGILTYDVEFELNEGVAEKFEISKEELLEKMKSRNEYFDEINWYVRDGEYVKEDNSKLKKKVVYKKEENKLYFFEGESEYVMIVDAGKYAVKKKWCK